MSDTATAPATASGRPIWRVPIKFALAKLVAASPALLFGVRLWASVCLALYLAFWLQLDNPYWAGTSAAIVCQPQLGASLRKGWFRLLGTLTGTLMSVALVACFPQDRILFLGGLALWVGLCAMLATVLRNFASYAAALAGYTVTIIAADLLGLTGGVDGNAAFLLAVSRATAICLGIVCAGVVLASTDLGGARRRLAEQFAELSAWITAGLTDALSATRGELVESQPVRRELQRRVTGLDPVVDQTLGESSQIRYHSPVMQSAVDGLFAALAAWRVIANHLLRLPGRDLQLQTAAILRSIPAQLRSASKPDAPKDWTKQPVSLHRLCEVTARRLTALSPDTASARLLADQAADAFAGIAQALNGLALLVSDPARAIPRRGGKRLRVPDWLPAMVNGGRAFVVVGGVALFWVATAWPGGSGAITFSAIVVLLLGTVADQAFAAAVLITLGAVVALVLTAAVLFAVLPATGAETFGGLSLVLGLCLVPMGAMLARAQQPWQTAILRGMTMAFMPLLQPTNQMSYDPTEFYNSGLAIIGGCAVAALSFRLLPPLSPAYRTRRLLALTLSDLRRLAAGPIHRDWFGHVRGRLVALPDAATPLQRAQLLAASSAGADIIQLRKAARDLEIQISGSNLFAAAIDAAFRAVAHGNSAAAIGYLSRADEILPAPTTGSATAAARCLQMRAHILALTEVLADHGAFFDTGAPDAVC
jgi:uncharacterized membrane protein YccC